MTGIADNLLEGLATLHDARMVHRDIKPANVFHTAAGRAVLLDLGIVLDEREQALTDQNVVLGTPEFMAPEHACGETCDARSDIYAAALIVLFGITGKRGRQNSPWQLTTRVRDEDWFHSLLEEVPQGWRAPLTRALRRDREARTASAAELRAQLLAAPIPAQWAFPRPSPDAAEVLLSMAWPHAEGTPPPRTPEALTQPDTPASLADAIPTRDIVARRECVRMPRLEFEMGKPVPVQRNAAKGESGVDSDGQAEPAAEPAKSPLPAHTEPSGVQTATPTDRVARLRTSTLLFAIAITCLILSALVLIRG